MTTNHETTYQAIAADFASSSPATSTGKMFGMPCIKNDGKAFAGYYNGAMVFKLTAPEHAEALSLSGARLFDPSGMGRAMKEWVEVPAEHTSRWAELGRAAIRYSAEGR